MYAIKLAEQQHYYDIYQIYKPFISDTIISFETTVPPINDFNQRINNTLVFLPWIVCILKDKVVGYTNASKYRKRKAYQWSVEVSVYIALEYRRRNIATALYTSLFSILELQNFKNLLAGISLPNNASILFHESMGFKKIAEYDKIGYKFGKWHSVGWWQKSFDKMINPPHYPIPLENIAETTKLKIALSKGESVLNIN